MLKQARLLARAVRHDWRLPLDYTRMRSVVPASLAVDEQLADVSPLDADAAVRQVQRLLREPATGPALDLVSTFSVPQARRADASIGTVVAGDSCLGELLYLLVRALRPAAIIETGVGPGLTSAYLLAGLADGDAGVLHSVDLPISAFIGLVGVAVPPTLRGRWRYHWGAARRVLPTVVQRSRPGLRLAFLDGDLRYAAVRWELEQVWPALEPGGWLVVNEAQAHTAVRDVAAEVGAAPLYARQATKPGWTGLLRKPG